VWPVTLARGIELAGGDFYAVGAGTKQRIISKSRGRRSCVSLGSSMSHKKYIERFHVDQLLNRLTKLGYSNPGDIRESERPDFVIDLADEQVGLETTRAVYQEYVRGSILHDTKCPNSWVITTHLMDGRKRRTDDEIVADMLNICGEWKDSEQDMRDWGDKIGRSLDAKRKTLNQSDFQRFSQNWLLIYDDPGLPNDTFTYDRACRHLARIFSARSTRSADYDAIFVLSDRYLFRFHNATLSLHYDATEA